MKQWKDFRWKDTEFLQERARVKLENAMKQSGYDAQAIARELDQISVVSLPQGEIPIPDLDAATKAADEYFAQQAAEQLRQEEEDSELDLTEEDIAYLKIKWGKAYSKAEWVQLEKLYSEMMESYDIQGAGHIDTLKMICKTSLKANQLIDCNDIDGYQKMSKVYDSLMKSANLTAAQNKAQQGNEFDSISELVTLCEKEGFIPRYYTSGPQDKVDETLLDLKKYTRTLVTEEQNLGNLIESALKKMQEEVNKEEDEDIEDDEFNEYDEIELDDEDFEEHRNFLFDEAEEDEELLKELSQ